MKTLCAILLLSLALPLLAADKATPEPAQSQRGRELFLKSAKGIACANCHSMAAVGNAIAPDLTTMATYAPPRGLVATMHMTMTEHVQLVKTNSGSFPALLKQKQGDVSEFWDLSQTPPALRQLAAGQGRLSPRQLLGGGGPVAAVPLPPRPVLGEPEPRRQGHRLRRSRSEVAASARGH